MAGIEVSVLNFTSHVRDRLTFGHSRVQGRRPVHKASIALDNLKSISPPIQSTTAKRKEVVKNVDSFPISRSRVRSVRPQIWRNETDMRFWLSEANRMILGCQLPRGQVLKYT